MAVNATAVWRVRPSGSNTNGGGYDAGISGAATDYSKQNSAQATGTNGAAAQNSTTFTDSTANAFTSAMVGNAIWIASGTNFVVGAYFVTAFTSASTVTLDRAPATAGAGSAGHWALGGGWADFWTNTDTSGNFGSNGGTWIVPGNQIYILGTGIPNPSSYSYDYTIANYFTPPSGTNSAGNIAFLGDPATPSYSTGGKPCISCNGIMMFNNLFAIVGELWLVANGTNINTDGALQIGGTNRPSLLRNLVFDQNGYDLGLTGPSGGYNANQMVVGCEIFSSQALRGTNAQYAYISAQGAFINNNVHDCIGPGLYFHGTGGGPTAPAVLNNIVAKNGGDGITFVYDTNPYYNSGPIANNTVDGNAGNGIILDQIGITIGCFNNVISNHTGGGKAGLSISAGTAAANDLIKMFVDYNTFYNNAANYSAISAGPHDTALGTSPYVASSTENYTLA